MSKLSKDQMLLLAAIDSGSLKSCNNETMSDDIKYLFELKLLEPIHRNYTDNERASHRQMGIVVIGPGPIVGYKLSPKGKSVLYSHRIENRRFWLGFWVNFIFALIATIISVIALLKR